MDASTRALAATESGVSAADSAGSGPAPQSAPTCSSELSGVPGEALQPATASSTLAAATSLIRTRMTLPRLPVLRQEIG
jgi:hypothetical protein